VRGKSFIFFHPDDGSYSNINLQELMTTSLACHLAFGNILGFVQHSAEDSRFRKEMLASQTEVKELEIGALQLVADDPSSSILPRPRNCQIPQVPAQDD
jgi:hypothetical protein